MTNPTLFPLLNAGTGTIHAPHLLWSLPFALLLAAIALFPPIAPSWWEKRFPSVALPLGAAVVVYYVFIFGEADRMAVIAHDYLSFICLIGSLFVVSGGMYIGIAGELTPHGNVALLAAGAALANIVGTTGAAMILIRPYMRGNAWRWSPYHIVFFIFIVANCGGALTPIGDPPLFLGYLKGVPFFWVFGALWYKWLTAIVLLLTVFYLMDRRSFAVQPRRDREEAEKPERIRFEGKVNILFVGIILGAAFVQEPVYLREAIMITAAAGSYIITPRRIHRLNEFNFHPIREVAILFAGIFACMVPALDWLSVNASLLGLTTSTGFYWVTGSLSAVLDNAPTYLNSLAAAMGVNGLLIDNSAHVGRFAAEHADLLRSISISAVFFGAATYIGNGPNFMCKSVVEHNHLKAPTFLAYVFKYTLPFLFPVLIVTYLWVR